MHQDFKFIVNLTKGYKDSDGRLFVEGIASSTNLDLTGERMSPDAIKSMAESLQKGLVEFRSEHRDDWDSTFGEVVEMGVSDDYQLTYKAELDPGFSKSHDLLHALAKGKKLGVSIGGHVIKAGMEWVEELKRSVYTYFDIALKEISVTAQPANPDAWVASITKSLDRDAINLAHLEDMKKNTTDTTPATTPEAPQAPPEEQATPATSSEQTEAQPQEQAPEGVAAQEQAPAEAPEANEATPTVDASPEEVETPEHAAESDENADPATVEEQEVTPPAVTTDPTPETPAEEGKPSEVTQKSQYLGEWAEAGAASSTIYGLTDSLIWRVSDAIAFSEETPAERVSQVDAMLTEFHAIVLRVATALINGMGQESATDAAKALKQTREVLTKSLTEQTTELDAVKKSLEERDAALAATQAEMVEKDAKVQELTDKLNAREARKARVYSPFDSMALDEAAKPQETKKSVRDAWMEDWGITRERIAAQSA
jgi:HK97 family phage prohead protease